MKILIVDDHAVVREGVAAMLRQADPAHEILQAENAVAGLAMAARHADLAVILLDLAMPGMAGMTGVAAFGTARPDVPVIVLSASENAGDVQRAFDAGALGYVAKSASGTSLLAAVTVVLAGEVYVPPFLLGPPTPVAGGVAANGVARLTARQVDVLRMLARGLSNKGIARALRVSDKTVKAHVTAIFRALDVANRTQAANVAHAAGILETE